MVAEFPTTKHTGCFQKVCALGRIIKLTDNYCKNIYKQAQKHCERLNLKTDHSGLKLNFSNPGPTFLIAIISARSTSDLKINKRGGRQCFTIQ